MKRFTLFGSAALAAAVGAFFLFSSSGSGPVNLNHEELRGMQSSQQTEISEKNPLPPQAIFKPEAKISSAREDINALLKQKSPSADFSAYQIAQRCIYMLESKRYSNIPHDQSDEKYCNDVLQRQLDDRVIWLKRSVEARVPGSAVEYYTAGPNGYTDDLVSRSTDPMVVGWKNEAIEYLRRDAVTGDRNAIAILSDIYSGEIQGSDKDISLSLAYALLLQQIDANKGKTAQQVIIDRMKALASPQEVAAAEEYSNSLYHECCAGR